MFCFLKGHWTSITSIFFISSSIEDLKSNQYQKFQLILPIRFHFHEVFCEQHHLQNAL